MGRNLRSTSFFAIVLAAVAVVLLRITLDWAHYPHSRSVCVIGLYAAVLPALVWFWRSSRTGAPETFRVPDCRLLVIAIFGVAAAAVGFSYDHGHTISDESAYQFQARIFASGRMKAEPMPGAVVNPAKTPPEIYFEQQVDSSRGWFSKYPPGWPFVLAAGYLLRCPWLVNPILGVLLLLLVNKLARPWGVPTQTLSVLVAGTSGYTLLQSVGFMSHGLAAVIGAAAFASLFHAARTERLGAVFLGFAFVVVGTEIRPFTGALVALVCTGYILYAFWSRQRLLWPSIGIIACAGLLSVALFCVINFLYTGSPLVSPYALSRGLTQVDNMTLDPLRIVANLGSFWRASWTDTLWSTFPFVLVAAAYAGRYECQFRRELICLALPLPLLVIAHLTQNEPSASLDGERYYYEGYALLCVVAVRGFLLLGSRWQIRAREAALGLLVLFGIQATFFVVVIRDIELRLEPWRLVYRSAAEPPTPSLIFLSSTGPDFAPKHANWNEAEWRTARVVFLNDPGAARRDEVACRFNRPAYRVVSYDVISRSIFIRDYSAVCPAS